MKLPKHRKYVEDDFDLDELIAMQAKNVERSANRKLIEKLRVVIFFLALFVAYLTFVVVNYYIEVINNKLLTDKARSLTVTMDPIDGTSVEAADSSPSSALSSAPPKISRWVDLTEDESPALNEKILALREEFGNDEIVGYVRIQGTRIDFPVVQGSDNEYYLSRDFSNRESVTGAAFMDFRCNLDPLGLNTVIYGHNMRDGSIFHDLRNFVDKKYLNEHSQIELETLYGKSVWEVFSFYSTDTGFDYIQTDFPVPDDFYKDLLPEIVRRSMHFLPTYAGPGDRILSLSTCTNTGDLRYALHAKLIEEEKSERQY
ncbi:MAG: class B sortase [Clostridiales bacterium]|nr:class B sortase [Clostridiales bacterium]MDR2750458.1 class B sortase [Clostridiales bacterium]